MDIDIFTKDASTTIKIFVDMVNDEISRVINQKVAQPDDLKEYLTEKINKFVSKYVESKDSAHLLKCLSEIHTTLSSIKLVGDDSAIKKPKTKIKEKTYNKKDNKEEGYVIDLAEALSCFLSKISYMYGSKGDHKVAYKIESFIKDIKNWE